MPILTRAQALKVDGRTFKVVAFPELKGELRLAELPTGPSEALAALAPAIEAGDAKAIREQTLIVIEHGIVDEAGEPLFDRASAEEFYRKLPISGLTRLVENLPKDEEAVARARAAREQKNGAIVAKALEGVELPAATAAIPSKEPASEKKTT